MRKRIQMAALSLLVAGGVQAEATKTDGCAELARVVYDEVQASALSGPGRFGPLYIGPERGEIHVCRTVSRTVSRAFTQAMASAGQQVRWPSVTAKAEHWCLSAFISQCQPDGGGFPRRTTGSGPVDSSWKTVSNVVMQHMFNPRSSDEVRFRRDELRLRLGLALRNARER